MQSYFGDVLERIKRELESTTSHYLAHHAQAVEEAKRALASRAAPAKAASQRKKKGAQGKGGERSIEATKAQARLATLEQRHKAWESAFESFRAALSDNVRETKY
jgi:hypothetical protein